mmetsp:Transcript_823/g.1298  ORF Transcript_823/g.1298 Transcript_823/m.1298 type:complete len:137 (-) Transcript_823:1159-1569(-)|eukprot:CAMPEP_0196825934 /NCGR_PEP_ID=MMETSP1362-20130617/93327_1 /TAXON_ID=163516 /ORGANISM="Leptocylindrus danicus, Strain CCMP1856" /LENGTH=136 /DNA_ID=CAMNT_0042206445 /DNA_START=745 /DNA_END=1155 /DNA_ORIENTATION=-
MASTIYNETMLNRRGELKPADKERMSKESPTKHVLHHSRGKVKLLQGENWFDMLYGVFHEPLREHLSMTSQTRICFDVDGPHCIVKSWSTNNKVHFLSSDENTADAPKDLTLYEILPSLQMKYLTHNDGSSSHYII